MLSIGLIGFGRAGGRFLRAVVHRQRVIGDVYLKAVCDSNERRLIFLREFGIKIYNNYLEMLKSSKFDIIIIATNEDSHFQILSDIKKYRISFKRILVEKLLVEKLEQAEKIKKIYNQNEISVHFVERHSSITKKIIEWMSVKELKLERASFFWGKYRLHDHRPTLGVTSEISHPIDLILLLAGIEAETKYEILNSCYLFSDYSYSGKRVLDSISANIKFEDGLVVNANSSFLWDGRERRLILYLSDSNKQVKYIVTIIFDDPHWDLDTCIICDVGALEGKRKLIHKWKIKKEDIEPEILCISKTSQFLEENINEVLDIDNSDVLSRLNQACYVQKIVASLEEDAEDNAVYTEIFKAKEPNVKRISDCDEILYKFLKGEMLEGDIIEWDNEF